MRSARRGGSRLAAGAATLLIVGGVLGATAVALLLSDAGGRLPWLLLLLADVAGFGTTALMMAALALRGSDRRERPAARGAHPPAVDRA